MKMDYLGKHLGGRGGDRNRSSNDLSSNRILIRPGLVEEAVHWLRNQGDIDLSELRFGVEEQEQGKMDSYVDIAVFQVPPHCNSRTCKLSEFGVGAMEQSNGSSYLNLCDNGRLQINRDVFRGHHMELLVPARDTMIQDRITDGANILISEQDRTYEVMIANCNKQGRLISLTGQVVFESFTNSSLYSQDTTSGLNLLVLGISICLFFTLCTFRIHMGTRVDYVYARLNTERTAEHQQSSTSNRHTPGTTREVAAGEDQGEGQSVSPGVLQRAEIV